MPEVLMLADGYLCSRHKEQRQETQLNWDRCQRGGRSAKGVSGSGGKQKAAQSRLVDWSLSTLGSSSEQWGCRHHLSIPLIFLVLTKSLSRWSLPCFPNEDTELVPKTAKQFFPEMPDVPTQMAEQEGQVASPVSESPRIKPTFQVGRIWQWPHPLSFLRRPTVGCWSWAQRRPFLWLEESPFKSTEGPWTAIH